MPFSDYLAKEVADWIMGVSAMPTLPTTMYLAAYTGTPATNHSNETAGDAYARQAINAACSNPGADGTFSNDVSLIQFPDPSTTYPAAITYMALVDALTAGTGNIIWTTPISPITPTTGSPLTFAVDSLTFDPATGA